MDNGAGASETPMNGTTLGCEIRLHITTSLQNTFGDSQLQLPKGDRERWVSHLCNLPNVIDLVNTESLYRNSLIIVNALPDVAITARSNSDLARLDEFFRYDVGKGE